MPFPSAVVSDKNKMLNDYNGLVKYSELVKLKHDSRTMRLKSTEANCNKLCTQTNETKVKRKGREYFVSVT